MILWNAVFPNRCLKCGKIIDIDKPVCEMCSHSFIIEPMITKLPNGCLCVSAFEHQRCYRTYMLEYKFNHKKYYYKNFAAVINIIINETWNDIHFDYYTSVPAHRDKIRKRGYDQTKLIAENAAHLKHIKYKQLLRQTSMNISQSTLSRNERIKNAKGIYEFSGKPDIEGKTIMLIDDVVTTGSTLSECAKILLENGAENVYCAAINR